MSGACSDTIGGVPVPDVLPAFAGLLAEDEAAGVALPALSTYVKYTGFEANLPSFNMTPSFAADTLTAVLPGTYSVAASVAAGGTAGESFQWEIFLNGLRTLLSGRTSFIAEVLQGISIDGSIVLAVGDVLDLRVRCFTAFPTVAIGRDAQLVAHRVSP